MRTFDDRWPWWIRIATWKKTGSIFRFFLFRRLELISVCSSLENITWFIYFSWCFKNISYQKKVVSFNFSAVWPQNMKMPVIWRLKFLASLIKVSVLTPFWALPWFFLSANDIKQANQVGKTYIFTTPSKYSRSVVFFWHVIIFILF